MATRARCLHAAGLLAAAAWLAAVDASAAERTFTVDYRASNRCPTRERFIREIERRTSTARLAGPAEQPEIVMFVRLEQGRRAKGRIDITAGTQTSERIVEGQSCADVAVALALIAAIAIDPLAESTFALPPLPLPPDPHVPRDVGTRPAIPLPNVPIPIWLEPRAGRGGMAPRFDEITLTMPPPLPAFPYVDVDDDGRPFRVGPGAYFALDVGPAPEPLVGVAGAVGITSHTRIAWSVRAELGYHLTVAETSIRGTQDRARFRMLRGRVEGCVPGWADLEWLRLWPCANLSGGALWMEVARTAGQDIARVEAASPWFSAGLSGRAELVPAEWASVEVRMGPDFPLVRGAYADDSREIHTPFPASFALGAGLGISF